MPEKEVWGTGQIARLCRVAHRTVSKWIDSGRLPAHRLPGCGDRRVLRKDLVEFLDKNAFPFRVEEGDPRCEGQVVQPPAFLVSADETLGELLAALLQVRGVRMVQARNAFAAGQLSERFRPEMAFLDMALGRAEALGIARELSGMKTFLPPGVRAADRPGLPIYPPPSSRPKGCRVVALTEPAESNVANLHANGVSAWYPRDQLPKALADLSASAEATPQLEYQP